MIEFLVGAGAAWVSVALGSWLRGRRRAIPKPVKPECGCGHHIALHDPQTNACHGHAERWSDAKGTHYVPCPCRQYQGPSPLPEFYAPEIAP